MKFNPNKYSLSQQMTFVVVIALLCQLVFVGALTFAHSVVEKQFEEEARSRKLISSGNGLILCLLRAAAAVGFYQFQKEEGQKRNFNNAMRTLNAKRAELQQIQSISRAEPEIAMMLNKLDDAFQLFTESQDIFGSGDEGGQRYAVFRISKQAKQLSQLNEKFVAKQDERSRAHEALEAQTRAWVNMLVYGGLTFNIALVLLLLYFFHTRTSHRFNTLSKNIVALGANKEIPDRLGGADELAMLDNVVHAVSQALREAERSKQEVMAMVTHDLRSPLTSLQLTLNVLHSGTMDTSSQKAKNMISRADASVGKLIQLINDLLDIDKIDSGRFTLDIQETEDESIIRQSIDLIIHSAEARNITLDVQPAKVHFDCDAERVCRILTNLLSNAIKFSPENSTIVVKTSIHDKDILFEITDQGRGMPEEQQDKVFERYHQVNAKNEEEKKGSGLGLTICKALVEAHGGKIGVKSAENEGSTFWFSLPMHSKSAAETQESANQSVSSLT